ncbi:MAG TPA: transglycosylase SLT domain-containing protein [Casimicrobiaceae bacterium]|nr:transglycosylase SLT domain-containing protein [Casimicrobiaceae bacterium]
MCVALGISACATAPSLPTGPIAFSPPPEQVPEAPPTPPEKELPAYRATGGDPDGVTNATLQLRSEYGGLWTRLRLGFSIPNLESPRVNQAEDWYATRPDYVARMVGRSGLYLYYIVGEVEKRGMPLEIALLPMIESAYNPMAYSRSRASGIWQFIPSTGKLYGLKQNWWFDERRDVVAATDGALDYLQRLYAEFGDWYLALAAYNCGEGTVRRAIADNTRRGKPTDYLSLKMPAETRDYVPRLQAVKNIVNDPEIYGLDLGDLPDAPYFTVVRTTKKMDVKIAAELAEMPLEDFLSLNPQHNRPVIAGADEFSILLPYDKAELFAAKLELSNQPMVTWQAYKLKAGETLPQVAVRFGLPLETLRVVNGIGSRATVPAGHAILVPTQAPSDATIASLQNTVFTTVSSGRTVFHRVAKGETLSGIATRYGVTQQELKTWNAGLGNTLVPGQRLRIVSDSGGAGTKAKTKKAAPASPSTRKASAKAAPAGGPRIAAGKQPSASTSR